MTGGGATGPCKCDANIEILLLTTVKAMILHFLKNVKVLHV